MRHFLIFAFIFSVGAGCTERGSIPAAPIATASEEAKSRDSRTPEKFYPAAIVKLADTYFESLPSEQRPADRERARDEFVRYFFVGFTNFTGSIIGGNAAGLQGFKSGQEFRRANRTKIRETFESFGYILMETEGVWTTAFEHSAFKPRDGKNQEWWLYRMPDTESDLTKNEKTSGGVNVRITGFRSPRGSYGHLGNYEYEFYATKIFKANGG